MGFYDNEMNVEQYIEMSKEYDNHYILKALQKHLQAGATILELGMGPGKDMESLNDIYHVTGSDKSKLFLEKYKSKHIEAELIQLDAVTLDTTRRFDCIFSNKVLQHLTRGELQESIEKQVKILNRNGIALHTFWHGVGEEEFDGLLFTYYDDEELKTKFGSEFEIIEVERYKEEEENDSIIVVCRRRG
jgi:SAM-dependent methyltransferase